MGTTYELYKIDKREKFDLGKGLGSENLFPSNVPFIIRDLYEFENELQREIEGIILNGYWQKDNVFVYSCKLAHKLFTWCKYDRIVMLSCYDFPEFFKKNAILNYLSLASIQS